MRNSYLGGSRNSEHRKKMHADQQALAAADAERAPGSPTAVKAGCRCDPDYNRQGLGCGIDADGSRLYSISSWCDLHAAKGKG